MWVADAQNKMKKRAIEQYYQYLKQWSKGYYDFSYQSLLHKILFIESAYQLDKIDPIYDKLLYV